MTLLKKLDGNWQPSENPGLAVGDTIEITDPRELILSGAAVAVGANGEEKGAFELYGVITDRERKEFEAFKALKAQKALGEKLAKEQEDLKKQLDETPEEESPAVDLETLPVPTEEELKKLQFKERMSKGREEAKAKKGLK